MTSAHLSAVARDPDHTDELSVATRRAAAVAHFVATARQLIGDPAHARREDLEAVARHLETLGRQTALFPEGDFPVNE